jgi:hypothetical protein
MAPADDPMVDVAILNVRSRWQAICPDKQRHACDGVRKCRSLHVRKLHSCPDDRMAYGASKMRRLLDFTSLVSDLPSHRLASILEHVHPAAASTGLAPAEQ